jgi:hypothetical protein
MQITRGDYLENLITIYLENHLEDVQLPFVTAIFQCGSMQRVINNPVFPLQISFTEEESLKLQQTNVCYLAVIDSAGKKRTCDGSLTFNTRGEVVYYD